MVLRSRDLHTSKHYASAEVLMFSNRDWVVLYTGKISSLNEPEVCTYFIFYKIRILFRKQFPINPSPRRTTPDGRTDPAGPPGTDGRTRKALKNFIFLSFS